MQCHDITGAMRQLRARSQPRPGEGHQPGTQAACRAGTRELLDVDAQVASDDLGKMPKRRVELTRFERHGRGDVQVSAVGPRDTRCVVGSWGPMINPAVRVNCFSASGAPADSAFTLQWVVASALRG